MQTSRSTFFRFMIPAVFILGGCTRHPMDASMRGWDHMMGYGNYGGFFMWLIWIVIIGAIFYLIVNRSRTVRGPQDPQTESAVDILKKRYARGEITQEEFEKLKKDIET